MAKKEKPVVKAYGAYALLRQTGMDFELELQSSFPEVYKEIVVVALINLVNGSNYDNNYQELFEGSVLSLWFPKLNLSDERMDKVIDWVSREENRDDLLDFMHNAIGFAANVLSGDPAHPEDRELREYYNLVKRNTYWYNPYRYGDNLFEFVSLAYSSRLEDDVRFAARENRMSYGYEDEPEDEEYEYEDEYDVDMKSFMKDAGSVNIICTPTRLTLSPIPERLAKFLSGTEWGLSLSLLNDMISF